jgi:glycosyltransferase involved in cell wall biosynthesis
MREPDASLHVAFVGRLIPLKGVDDLMKGVSLTRNPSRIHVSVVGSGHEEAYLRSMALELGLRVRFHGPLDAAGVHKVLAESDVLAVPSRDTRMCSEQWGRVVVEAMMTGRSVLASDSGELPLLVGQPDWIFRQNDPESLGRALDVLLADSSLATTRADTAYQRAQLFAPRALAAQLIDFWGEVFASWRDRTGHR